MQLKILSENFYENYSQYPEILKKEDRPYACMTIELDGLLFAVPFRHHINLHSAAFQLAAQIVMKVVHTFKFSCYNRSDFIRHSRHQCQMPPPICC